MEKLKMHSKDLSQDNLAKIQAAFPNCITERKNDKGQLELAIDFDLLRQELSASIVEGPQERYRLDWPGKREAMLTANAPIAKTLRPARDESVNFDETENLFIEGDNLDALKLLQETYLGKVKMIYIDPPYNTGNDFVYEDDFAESTEEFLQRSNQKDEKGNRLLSNPDSKGRFHSDWLSMMHSRLKLSRNLLGDTGIVFVSIDKNEVGNLEKLLIEIFGSENYLGTFPVIMNLKGNQDAFGFAATHEYIAVATKVKKHCNLNHFPIDDEGLEDWEEDSHGLYKKADTLRRTGQDASRERRPKGWFPVFIDRNDNVYVTGDNLPKEASDFVLYPRNESGDELSWSWGKEKISKEPHNLIVINGRSGKNIYKKQRPSLGELPTKKPKSLFYKPEYSTSTATNALKKLFGEKVFDGPKPMPFIKDLVLIASNHNDIILDFFAGASTTAHAVMQLNAEDGGNRKFIMVQLPEAVDEKHEAYKTGYKTIAEISRERICRAGAQILQDECHENWNKDIGFRVLKVDTSNMQDVYYQPQQLEQEDLFNSVDNIKPDRSSEDLLFQVLLDWGVDLTLPIRRETIQGKEVFIVDDNALVACFEQGISEDLIHELAAINPLRAVFRDNGFASDAIKVNTTQIFKQRSPITEVKTI